MLRKVVFFFVHKLTAKTKTTLDDELLDSLKKPVDFFFIIVGLKFTISFLILPNGLYDFMISLIRSGFALALFWSIFNMVTPLSHIIHTFSEKFGKELSSDIANFLIKTLKLLILLIGFVSVLQEWGYNISGFLASLGLVGMAFALAAKDTAANLFGSLVIFSDRPFKVGDWIKTPDIEGTVEEVGIRSTKIRTFAQAVVTVPNAVLANSAILNWSRMGKRRIKMKIGLTYSTTQQQINDIVNDIRSMLQNHNEIHQDTIFIYFTDFDDSSLGIFCYYFTKTTNWGEFMRVKEDTNLKIMQIVQKHNASFAFPSQSLYIEKIDKEMI
jgi:MscS family membrane protein